MVRKSRRLFFCPNKNRKHGIIERDNYNKPKLENGKQRGCPEEKVKAIEVALRHFQMI